MALSQVANSGLCSFLAIRSDFGRKWGCLYSDFELRRSNRPWTRRLIVTEGSRIFCRFSENEKESNGDEPPESLFMKELKKRGMTPTFLLEESSTRPYELNENEPDLRENDGIFSKRNGVASEDFDKRLSNQRDRSMALNSEGLEGLIPRAKMLLTIGGTFFLGFGPLILGTIGVFTALYLYFGSNFVHDASESPTSPPPYIDPYKLLEDERLSHTAPTLE